MRASLVVLISVLAGCGARQAEEATVDASSSDAADATPSGSDAQSDTATDGSGYEPGPPCAPIAGTAPFGVRLAGTGPISSGADASGTVSASLDVYFPSGRVPGGEVVLVGRTYAGTAVTTRGVLDATLSARGLKVSDPYCLSGVQGDLLGPSDGFAGIASNNTTAPSDVVTMVSGPVKLCSVGAVPVQKVTLSATTISPLGAWKLRASRPFARGSLSTVSASIGTSPAAIDVREGDPGVVVAPKGATFSLFVPTEIDLSGLRDVLGAPLGLSSVKTLVPTEVVADRTFTTLPPSNAWVGASLAVASGVLLVGADEDGSDGAVAMALGTAPGKTKLRLRHRVDCTTGSGSWSITVVAPDATSEVVSVPCGTATSDRLLALPGSGPWVLVARRNAGEPRPCWYAGGLPPTSVYQLDELAFE